MKNRSFLKDNLDILLLLIIYSIIASVLFQYFQYMIAGDEISYINIARAYATSNWGTAINGYWSPFYSWLITPLLLFRFNPLYAVYASKIVSLIIGFFTIIIVRKLSRTFEIDRNVERSILLALIPSLIFFSLIYPTPDLLLVLFLTYYLSIILKSEYPNSLINGVICGFVGAAAYLTKSFAFPFFLVHFVLFNVIFFVKGLKIEKKIILKNLFLGLLVFFVVSGLWVGNISEKYGKLTISTAGEYNQAIVGPKYQENTIGYGQSPLDYQGLIKPPQNTINIWDNPSYLKVDRWNPLASWKDFDYELKLFWSNIFYTFNIIQSFMPIAVFILIAMIIFILRSKDVMAKNILKYLLLTMIIYIGGYCLIIPEWRYLWFIFVLLMISSFYMVDRIYKSNIMNLKIRNILLFLLVFSFIIQPAIEVGYYASQPNDKIYNLSNTLKVDYGVHGNIASNANRAEMLTLSYYLNGKYYGISKKSNNSIDLQKELNDNRINYYFVWNSTDNIKLSDYNEIVQGKIEGLKIYSKNQ